MMAFCPDVTVRIIEESRNTVKELLYRSALSISHAGGSSGMIASPKHKGVL